ncbi:hypothetical protein LINPERPRIM_LOCUS3181 [Linum perenne]
MKTLRTEAFPGCADFPHKAIWIHHVPSKIQCFLWMAFHGKIETIDNLQRRGFQLPNRCVLCCSDVETIDHLLIHCSFSTKVWKMFSSALSFSGPFPLHVQELVRSWKGMNCLASWSEMFDVLLHACSWFLWLERNDRIFKDREKSEDQVVYKIFYAIGTWLRAFDRISESELRRWFIVFHPSRPPDYAVF